MRPVLYLSSVSADASSMDGDQRQDPTSPSEGKEIVQPHEQDDSQAPGREACGTKDQDQSASQTAKTADFENPSAELDYYLQNQDQATTRIDFVTLGMFIIGEPPNPPPSPTGTKVSLATTRVSPS